MMGSPRASEVSTPEEKEGTIYSLVSSHHWAMAAPCHWGTDILAPLALGLCLYSWLCSLLGAVTAEV